MYIEKDFQNFKSLLLDFYSTDYKTVYRDDRADNYEPIYEI